MRLSGNSHDPQGFGHEVNLYNMLARTRVLGQNKTRQDVLSLLSLVLPSQFIETTSPRTPTPAARIMTSL